MRGPDKIVIDRNITPFLELKIPDSIRVVSQAAARERASWAAFLDVPLFAAVPAVGGGVDIDKVGHKGAIGIGGGVEDGRPCRGVWPLSGDRPRSIVDIGGHWPGGGGFVDDNGVVART